MEFEADEDKPIRERAVEYLQHRDGAARAFEIADAVGSDSPDYTRRECNDLAENGILDKHYGDTIVGYPLPGGDWEVLPNHKGKLLGLVEKYEDYLPFSRDDVEDMPAPNLRTLLESELAVGEPRPFTRKVAFSCNGDSAEA